MKDNKIIPISYCTPTGVRFISAFLTAAKNNDFTMPSLMKYGNPHDTGLDDVRVPRGDMRDTDEDKLNIVLNAQIQDNPPYFISTHIKDLSIIQATFDKSIRITYTTDDIDELINVYIGKVCFDVFNRDLTVSKQRGVIHKNYMHTYANMYVDTSDSNVLCISWRNIFHDDANLLIERLCKFTGIPLIQFNVESLINWRRKTKECISVVERMIN